MSTLILKRASASRSSGQWRDDDYDVVENGVVVGRIFKVPIAPIRNVRYMAAFGVIRTMSRQRPRAHFDPKETSFIEQAVPTAECTASSSSPRQAL
jgi:hypothetical protein